MEPSQVLLAIFGGAGFGLLAARIGTTWQRMLVMLVLLWTMLSGPQMVFRWLHGSAVIDEVLVVTILRAAFTAAAIVAIVASHPHRQEAP